MAELFFGEFRLDTRKLSLSGPSGPVEMRAKTLQLLRHLIDNRNRFVPRIELLAALWRDGEVGASSLN